MKKISLHSCNVLEVNPENRRLWQFQTSDEQLKLGADRTIEIGQPLPPRTVSKDWRSLWQRKLNVALLPADQVFLRVIHLPASDWAETVSMVEFQLEKLSPLPVNQIVWSLEVLPHAAQKQQTVIIAIAARDGIEQFLGRLEGDGFLPDRLELPSLQQLLATRVEQDGVWIFTSVEAGKNLCLVAWWCVGILHQLQLLHLPQSSQAGSMLVEQLTKIAWAGEMEGWLTGPLRCHLVADLATAASWEAALGPWAGAPVTVTEPLGKPALAEFTADRAARDPSKAGLLPAEFPVRYKQQWVDHLWMSGLGALVAAYFVGVAIYFGALQVLNFQHHSLQKRITALSPGYTNAVKLKARAEVLQGQRNLKYAALDSLRVAAELLPPELTLSRFAFAKGRKLTLEGVAPQDQSAQLTEYNAALSKATVRGEVLFTKVEPPRWDARGQQIAWRFTCDLNYQELE